MNNEKMKNIMVTVFVITAFGLSGGKVSAAETAVIADVPAVTPEQAGVNNLILPLIDRAVDSENWFRQSAEKLSDPDLQTRFRDRSEERARYTRELKALLRSGESAEASTHGTWTDVKDFFSSENDREILKAMKAGEKEVLETYERVLERELPQDVRRLLKSQQAEIKDSYEWVSGRLEA